MIRLFWALVLTFSSQSFAEKMNIKNHSLVISKLERVIENSGKKSEHNVGILLRLADLYAERARLKALKEGDKNCQYPCLGSDVDRRAAIQNYSTILPHVDGEVGSGVIMQTAHLHQLLNEGAEAKKLYKKIIKEKSKRSSMILGQAYAGLAGIHFIDNEFKTALKNYNLALSQKDVPKKGFIRYRKAWCLLNTGKTSKAIAELRALLSNVDLLDITSGGDTDGEVGTNASFKADVSRDYASFLARKKLTAADIDSLAELSPAEAFQENLFFLGTEAERVGQHKAALIVWNRYLENDKVSHEQKLEIQVRTAKILFDLNRKQEALNAYKVALGMWKKKGCKDQIDCQGIEGRFRNFPIQWNKLEKKKPSKLVHLAYLSYVEVFSNDFEMMNWAAQISRKRGEYLQSSKDYRRAGIKAKKLRKIKDKERAAKARKIYDGALLAEIEMAEVSGNGYAKRSAYNYFLKEKPKGAKSDEIKYQLTTLDYEEKKYQRAAFQFQALALKSELPPNVKVQAADLSLDALAILKDHQRIETWGLDYAKQFPKKKVDYTKTARKATLNLVAIRLNKKPSRSDLKEIKKTLSSFKASALPKEEKLSYWKSRLLVAEQLRDLHEMKRAASGLLALKEVSKKEVNWAKSLKVFAHEMLFEFRTAYDLAKQTSFPKLTQQQVTLKLAVLADLAGRKSEADSYYATFIKKSRSYRQANTVRAQLISKSKAPWRLIKRDLVKLSKTPDILAKVALESFGRFTHYTNAEKVLKYKAVWKYPEGKTLGRFVFLKDYWVFDKKIRKHRISQRSQSRLSKDLKKRISLLAESESWAAQATRSADWTLQLITLSRLKDEKKKFYNKLIGLRPPRGLNKAQRDEYKKLLAQQAKPYMDSAVAISRKVDEFWKNGKALDSIETDYQRSNHAVRSLVRDELVALRTRAPSSAKRRINNILANRPKDPRLKEVNQAYKRVKSRPFEVSPLNELIRLEERRDKNPTMVAYLAQRKLVLKGGK